MGIMWETLAEMVEKRGPIRMHFKDDYFGVSEIELLNISQVEEGQMIRLHVRDVDTGEEDNLDCDRGYIGIQGRDDGLLRIVAVPPINWVLQEKE